MIIYKSLDQWEEALKSESAPISGYSYTGDETASHDWSVCAVGCKIKEELGYDPKRWSSSMIESSISSEAQQLGHQFTRQCRESCRKSALETLHKIRNLPSVFSNLIR